MGWAFVLLAAFLGASAFGALGAYVAAEKGRSPAEGAVLGFLFGPLGALIVALMPEGEARRPGPPRTHDDDGLPDELPELPPAAPSRSIRRPPSPLDQLDL